MYTYPVINDPVINDQYIDIEILNYFQNLRDKRYFIRKTFGYFLLSLLSIFSSCLTFMFISNSDKLVLPKVEQILNYCSCIFLITIILAILCNCNILRKNPIKYFNYFIFTLSISWLIGQCIIYIDSNIVILPFIIMIVTVTGLIIYNLITKTDFIGDTEYILVTIIGFIITGTFNFYIHSSILEIVLVGSGSTILSILIVYDIQMIITGKHIRYKYNLNDSVFTAMNLYLDVINIFIYAYKCIRIK